MNDFWPVILMGGIQLTILIGIVYFLNRKSRFFTCPVCQAKVDRQHIQLKEIACPFCEWQVKSIHSKEVPQRVSTAKCRSCNADDEEVPRIQMWDGQTYCKSCIDEVSPQLWEYSHQHDLLTETLSHSTHRYFWRSFLFLYLGIIALFGTLAFVAGFSDGGLVQGLKFLGAVQFFILPLTIVFAGAGTAGFAMHRPTISVENGELTLQQGSMSSQTDSLHEYEWFHGDLSKSNLMEKGFMPSGPAILLVVPQDKVNFEKYAAVGFNDHTREIWTSFLTLAGVKRREDWEKPVRAWQGVMNVAAAILAIPVGLGLCFALSLGANMLIESITGDRDLAVLLGGQFLMPGSIYLFMMAAVMLGGAGGTVQRDPGERTTIYRRTFWPLFSLSVFFALMILTFPQFALHARIISGVVMVMVGYFASKTIADLNANRH